MSGEEKEKFIMVREIVDYPELKVWYEPIKKTYYCNGKKIKNFSEAVKTSRSIDEKFNRLLLGFTKNLNKISDLGFKEKLEEIIKKENFDYEFSCNSSRLSFKLKTDKFYHLSVTINDLNNNEQTKMVKNLADFGELLLDNACKNEPNFKELESIFQDTLKMNIVCMLKCIDSALGIRKTK